MSFFEKIFGQAPAAPAPAPASTTNNPNTNQPPAPPASSTVTAPNGLVPEDGNKKPEESPAAKYADLWEPPKTEESKQVDNSRALTPAKMLEAAAKVDFSKVLDQESLAKIKAGGDDAVTALATLLNKTSQQVYGQSIVVAKQLTDQAVSDAEARFTKELPNLIRQQSARESLLSENPAYKNPVVAPVVAAIQSQLQLKYPKATASELNEMAREVMKDAAGVLSSDPKAEAADKISKKKTIDAEDWDSWINTPVSGSTS